MSRTLIPLLVSDLSSFAKALKAQLSARESLPSHVELLNMLARAAGHGNFQSLRAGAARVATADSLPAVSPAPDPTPQPAPDRRLVERVARCFDRDGLLVRWPARRSDQVVVLHLLAARFPSGEVLAEPAVNALLRAAHSFGDHALLRRELCDLGLLTRTPSGSAYRRPARPLPPEANAVLSVQR